MTLLLKLNRPLAVSVEQTRGYIPIDLSLENYIIVNNFKKESFWHGNYTPLSELMPEPVVLPGGNGGESDWTGNNSLLHTISSD